MSQPCGVRKKQGKGARWGGPRCVLEAGHEGAHVHKFSSEMTALERVRFGRCPKCGITHLGETTCGGAK